MSTRLIILGLLKDRPLHGYELKQIIEKNMGDWTKVAFGSIYFALSLLSKEKLVERVNEEKIGNRPSRNIYRTTQKGKEEFYSLLKKSWANHDREFYPLDVALAFSNELPGHEVAAYLKKRIKKLEEILLFLEKHKQEQILSTEVPKIAGFIFSHSDFHIKAELNWLKSVLVEFEKKE